MNELISIIIPTYNSSKWIDETLNSVLNQTYFNWECILVDDDSVDDSEKIIIKYSKKDKRIKFLKRPNNRIKCANTCRNFGFEKASGNFIQWFDSDDLMHPRFLELKVQEFKKSYSDFVVCKGAIFKGKIENKIGDWDKLSGTTPVLDQALGRINFQTNAPMFRRDFLDGKKLWNETLQRKQDYEFFNRILAQSANYKIVNECLFFYRQHSQSINGINSPTTIRSMILADLLVYKNTIQAISEEDDKFKFQQHFFRKIISRSKIALKSKYVFTYFKGLWGALSFIDFDYIINYFQRR
ncbi:glycosyltransferase [Salegentibacter sp. Hel_I_6]|uniref:glycosyltransferase family 2 protein n=1 Tax=Salegentibacter sp. Hel_I_6 TaxID=1250278 RepID=UPI00056CD79C|nr:glycosyltransferase [Salegentibacter sp. Hel_I_6]